MTSESLAEGSGDTGAAAPTDSDRLHRPANMEEFAPGFGAAENVTPAPDGPADNGTPATDGDSPEHLEREANMEEFAPGFNPEENLFEPPVGPSHGQ